MAIPELTPYQKYEQFCKANPKYSKMNLAQVCSIMVDQKILTAAEAQDLSKPLFFKKGAENFDILNFSGADIWGLSIGNQVDKNVPKNYVEQPKIYHPKIKSLELTPSGKVDLNNYTLDALKSRYPNDEYNIEQPAENVTIVRDLADNIVFIIDKNNFGTVIQFHETKNIIKSAIVNDNGEISSFTINNLTSDKEIATVYESRDMLPVRSFEVYKDGSRLMTNYDSKTGKKVFEDYWKKDANMATWSIEYSDGKPYKKITDGKVENFLVEDLKKCIDTTNILALSSANKSLSENVLKRISYNNVVEILEVYKCETGRDLLQDIADQDSLGLGARNKLINHIETLYCLSAPAEVSGNYLAKQLFEDIDGLGSGRLLEHIKMIDSRNLKYVLVEYKRLTLEDNYSMQTKVDRVMSMFDFDDKVSDAIVDNLAPIEGLLTAIDGEIGLDENTKKNLIKQIIDISLEGKSAEVRSRIAQDIERHSEDYHKIEVDLYRAENSKGGELRNPELQKERIDTSNNKTFLGQIKQGRTGDCWLLAALNSIIAKPEMLNRLEQQVVHNPAKDEYTVHLKGPNKVYKITREELDNYTTIASGSEKVNAVEIAMDKYIRDEAYDDRERGFLIDGEFGHVERVTIDANWSKFLWNSLLGYSYTGDVIDPAVEDFNNPSRVYSLSLREDIPNISATSQKEENYFFHRRHAYSILGSDEKNLYLSNPWDSADIITISREDFVKLDPLVEVYDISNSFSTPDQGTNQ